uniref:Odorant receptor n=1 Tax=Yemma signatus TaxID=300820 RepID=A0A385H5Z8_9HEMI|nr:odorant receptor [Yemma signatus]
MTGKRDLSDLVLRLKIHGGWYDLGSRNLSYLQRFRLVCFVGMLPFILVAFFRAGLIETLNKSAYLSFGAVYVTVKAVSYYLQRDRTRLIVERLVYLIQERRTPYDIQIFDRYSKLAWKSVYLLEVVSAIYVSSYFGFPMIYELGVCLAGTADPGGEPYSFPHPLESLIPKRRSGLYYLIWFLSAVWCWLLLAYAIVSLGFLFVVVTYCCILLRSLAKEIEAFSATPEDGRALGRITLHYQQLLQLSVDMKAVIGPPMAAQNAVGALLLTLLVYNISHNLKGDPMLLMVNVFAWVTMINIIFMSCLTGEMLQAESQKIYESFCDLPYHEMPPKLRKALSFLILLSLKPMVINYKRKLPLNLRFFQEIVDSSYTYFMLLNSLA